MIPNHKRKPLSAYQLQYQHFEERLRGNKHKLKLPILPNKQPIHTQNYLQLARQMINNQAALWFTEDKENELPITTEPIVEAKQKFSRIKNKIKDAQVLQQSQQLTRGSTALCGERTHNMRARVMSQALKAPSKLKGPVNFLKYKKCKKEVSTRFKKQ